MNYKAGKAPGWYQKIWDNFQAADRDGKRKIAQDYPEILTVAKGEDEHNAFSAARTRQMAEKSKKEFE